MQEPPPTLLPSTGPTQLVLGIAATEVFDALPDDAREQLPKVPTLIRRLERAQEVGDRKNANLLER